MNDLIAAIIANDQFRILAVLVLVNLILGVLSALVDKTFDLTRVAEWVRTRLAPVLVLYAVGWLVTWAAPSDPILSHVRDVVFATQLATLVGLLFSNFAAFGIVLPTSMTGDNAVRGSSP